MHDERQALDCLRQLDWHQPRRCCQLWQESLSLSVFLSLPPPTVCCDDRRNWNGCRRNSRPRTEQPIYIIHRITLKYHFNTLRFGTTKKSQPVRELPSVSQLPPLHLSGWSDFVIDVCALLLLYRRRRRRERERKKKDVDNITKSSLYSSCVLFWFFDSFCYTPALSFLLCTYFFSLCLLSLSLSFFFFRFWIKK